MALGKIDVSVNFISQNFSKIKNFDDFLKFVPFVSNLSAKFICIKKYHFLTPLGPLGPLRPLGARPNRLCELKSIESQVLESFRGVVTQ